MDGKRFDDLTRTLGRKGSRRQVLAAIGGAFATLAGVREGSAQQVCDDGPCSGGMCCGPTGSKTCCPFAQPCCGSGELQQCCVSGTYGCGSGDQTCVTDVCYAIGNGQPCRDNSGICCNQSCVTNPQTDPNNCGACGVICPTGTTCAGGACVCAAPTTLCGSACVDLQSDPANCGACGVACPGGTACSGGACQCTDPSATLCGSQCVNLQSDPANCGACGNACTAGATCTSGSCTTPGPCGSAESVCGFPLSNAICCDDTTEFCCEQLCPDNEDRACCPNGYQCGGTTGVGIRCIPPGSFGFHFVDCCNGYTLCPHGEGDTLCVDTQTTPSHCGACGNACPTGATCVSGQCDCGELTVCGNACVDLQSDPANCGSCGNACSVGATCESGSCSAASQCEEGASTCGYPPDNAICCDDETEFCCSQFACAGQEDRACCPNGYECSGVTDTGIRCIPPGESGFFFVDCCNGYTLCPHGDGDTLCADLQSWTNHCGACGNVCPPDATCVSGECVCSDSATTACGDACVDLQTDEANCGACDNTCPADALCVSGECACPLPTTICADACVDLQTNSDHCGSCDAACPEGAACADGECACTSPTTLCEDQCVDLQTDPANCGSCGNACQGGALCHLGACLPECGNGKTTDACACDGNVCQAGQSCTGKAGARTCNGQGQPEPTGCEATLQEAGCTRDKKGNLICSGLDLTGADFSGCVLPAIHFKSVNLAGSLFDGAELDDATVFESVDLSGASFTNVNMAGVHVVASSLSGTIFDGAIWTGCGPKSSCNQIAKSNAIGASFAGANLTGLSLASSDFSGATFASATLDGTIIGGSIFANAVFDLVSMTNASDLSSTFVGASFCGASLDGTVFRQSICPDGTRSDKKLRTCAGHLGTEACPS